MKRILKIAGAFLIVALAASQFIRPDRSTPASNSAMAISARLNLPADVRTILERSCYDCHSHLTRWPWYSAVSPVSWIVANDVREGRAHVNFSDWGSYTRGKQIAKLEMIVTEVDGGKMPPGNYLLLHRDASLSKADVELLCAWAEGTSDSLTTLGR